MTTIRLPWKAMIGEIFDRDGDIVASVGNRSSSAQFDCENAELIVRAVNSHAALVAALKMLRNTACRLEAHHPSVFGKADAALSHATQAPDQIQQRGH